MSDSTVQPGCVYKDKDDNHRLVVFVYRDGAVEMLGVVPDPDADSDWFTSMAKSYRHRVFGWSQQGRRTLCSPATVKRLKLVYVAGPWSEENA